MARDLPGLEVGLNRFGAEEQMGSRFTVSSRLGNRKRNLELPGCQAVRSRHAPGADGLAFQASAERPLSVRRPSVTRSLTRC